MSLYIEKRHLDLLKTILQKYEYDFFAFGSRVTGKHKTFSDLDLFYNQDIPLNIIFKLEEEFEESDLPYKIDLINYNKCDPSFKESIGNNFIKISPKE